MAGMNQVDLSDLDVPIGTSVQLEFISPPGRHLVKVLGDIPGSSLILSCPRSGGKNMMVRDNQIVNVRLMLDTHVYAFSSKVAKSYLEPAAHLHIAYPTSVEVSEVRQTGRIETRLICNLEGHDSIDSIKNAATGIIIDLSLGGVKLISKDDFGSVNQKSRLIFNVKIGPHNHLMKINCEIRSQEIQMLEEVQSTLIDNEFLAQMGVEYFYVYGIRFLDTGKEIGIPLTAFILEPKKNKANK